MAPRRYGDHDSDGDDSGIDEDILNYQTLARKKHKVKQECAVKREPQTKKPPMGARRTASGNDEVELVTAPPCSENGRALADMGTEGDGEVLVVGSKNHVDLPHARHDCVAHRFATMLALTPVPSIATITVNKKHCDLCYCYVCDCLVKDCASWCVDTSAAGIRILSGDRNHCCAHADSEYWMRMRSSKKRATSSSTATSATHSAARPLAQQMAVRSILQEEREYMLSRIVNFGPDSGDEDDDDDDERFQHDPMAFLNFRDDLLARPARGPLPPGSKASLVSGLIKCRKCGWFSNLAQNKVTYRSSKDALPTCHDWCHKCGRVASTRFFGRIQCESYSKKRDDVYFGERKFTFRINAHDPREFEEEYKESWDKADGESAAWTYDEAEMEFDVFRHRMGKNPLLSEVLRLTPNVKPDRVPKSGHVPEKSKSPHWGIAVPAGVVSADETDFIIFDDPAAVRLLASLGGSDGFERVRRTRSMNQPKPPDRRGDLGGDLNATWDKVSRTGTLTVRVFLTPDSFRRGFDSAPTFVGVWCGILPLPLGDISGMLEASGPEEGETPDGDPFFRARGYPTHLAKYKAPIEDEINERIWTIVDNFNETREETLGTLALKSSAGGDTLGGVSTADNSIRSVVASYFRERLPHKVAEIGGSSWGFAYEPWVGNDNGAVSRHRKMSLGTNIGLLSRNPHGLDLILGLDDYAVATSCLSDSARRLVADCRGIQGIMRMSESLGHAECDPVEGLNVELLSFQRQSLKWAIEREQVDGGIQSFFRQKLAAEDASDVYFDFIQHKFFRTAPKIVRGGIIAHEMGLGKTLISLGLFLMNPAPLLPKSGSPVQSINTAPAEGKNDEDVGDELATAANKGWDKGLYAETSKNDALRGSIISRGTLVVCPVSLVGQWIAEAKSKLKNPGLVYPYHGQGRVRNARVLCENAIVVTTYQVLASDATYHRDKAIGEYCPPLETIRWWRVIADEGHSLKAGNTARLGALMSIVADHKWIVTGTPMSTAVSDLKNQLRFVGIDEVDAMFNRMGIGAANQVRKRRRHDGDTNDGDVGRLMFLLRSIMARNAQKQSYRNTTTTLMSLPPKTERTIEIAFTDEERTEYDALEETARATYTTIKGRSKKLGTHTLAITQLMTPIRVACAGGRYPLPDDDTTAVSAGPAAEYDSDDEDGVPKKRAAKRTSPRNFSSFVFNSKLKVLIDELEKARDNDPSSKSLIFSQFTSTLEWLQTELPKHGFQYRTLKGSMSMKQRAKALDEFQNDPPTTIFLLSMRAGAVGINLTASNRVFMLEPSMNPALEAQAVGRVHRLGQKRPVQITRLLMKDSIETRLRSLIKEKFGGTDDDTKPEKNDKVPASVTAAGAHGGDDPMVAAAAKAPVGSLTTERSVLLAQEFDFLLRVDPVAPVVPYMDIDMPDTVGSALASRYPENDSDDDGYGV